MKARVLFLFFVLHLSVFSQQEFAKSFVSVFASDEFKGRGYVDGGNEKAAQYLADQFARFGVKPYAQTYFQKFGISVNTFPSPTHVIINDSILTEGVDYIVDPYSGSSSGVFSCFYVDFFNLSKASTQIKNTVFVIDPSITQNKDSIAILQRLKYQLSNTHPVVWLNSGKLTWSVATEQGQNAILEIKKETFGRPNELKIDVKNEYIQHFETQNVIGFIKGKKKKKHIVITAHYDHLGKMGNAIFNGANDNASGVASMLYLAQHFASKKPKYSMVFIAFGAEEVGLLGSEYYVKNPAFPLKQIKFLINLDLNGTGEEGVTVVNGTLHKKEFLKLTNINNEQHLLEKIKVRGQAANSDHYWFTQQSVPAFFIYTMGGVSHYHDVYDRPETLPLTEFNDLTSLLIQFIDSF
ncbi:MAG: M28 family metallopeptidase [Bacteroidia bacterium]